MSFFSFSVFECSGVRHGFIFNGLMTRKFYSILMEKSILKLYYGSLYFFVIVPREGVEPPTCGSEDRRSIQLSYRGSLLAFRREMPNDKIQRTNWKEPFALYRALLWYRAFFDCRTQCSLLQWQ